MAGAGMSLMHAGWLGQLVALASAACRGGGLMKKRWCRRRVEGRMAASGHPNRESSSGARRRDHADPGAAV